MDDDGVFCAGPREKVDAILAVWRYASQWPLIPIAELHASSVQHPDDPSMRWLLHSRRVPCLPEADSPSQSLGHNDLPPCAGVGDKEKTVWCCRLCVDHLCTEHPTMPPLALANSFFGGRHHPLFREASLATRLLASSARLVMRQLFLGKGADDEVHKGMTGNTMLISQPSPSYEQVFPNVQGLPDKLVVLFCKSIDDVSKAQVLMVNREQYREMMLHRRRVCPSFTDIVLDEAALHGLPDDGVPDFVLGSAIHMHEAAKVQTTLHGPANRIPVFSRPESEEAQGDDGLECAR